jgi:hypothetical protein
LVTTNKYFSRSSLIDGFAIFFASLFAAAVGRVLLARRVPKSYDRRWMQEINEIWTGANNIFDETVGPAVTEGETLSSVGVIFHKITHQQCINDGYVVGLFFC